MDYYEIWCDLAPGVKDLDFSKAVEAFLGHMVTHGKIEGFSIKRRKLGFGPAGLGEWNISIRVKNLTQLDEAFLHAAPRTEPVEALHVEVFSKVVNYKSGLYRDFPDPFRAV